MSVAYLLLRPYMKCKHAQPCAGQRSLDEHTPVYEEGDAGKQVFDRGEPHPAAAGCRTVTRNKPDQAMNEGRFGGARSCPRSRVAWERTRKLPILLATIGLAVLALSPPSGLAA